LAELDEGARLAAAREIFDRRAKALYEQSHPLVRAKWSSPEMLPYYNLYRERAALEAIESASRVERIAPATDATRPANSPRLYAEKKLVSIDGLLVGRPDLIDCVAQEIIDYKTGVAPDEAEGAASAAEVRQLRLYVHLAFENGVAVSRAIVARADGHRASIDVSKQDADGEGRTARGLLAQYNNTVGGAFDESAQPSPENCSFCPCIPFCEAFWRTASPAWAEQCGVHLEGTVSSVDESTVQGMKLTTLRVEVQRGTVGSGDTFVEQIPNAWITADGTDAPRQGDAVRVVNGKLESEAPPQVIRVNRTATSVWSFAAER
jgi:hypothetical protein